MSQLTKTQARLASRRRICLYVIGFCLTLLILCSAITVVPEAEFELLCFAVSVLVVMLWTMVRFRQLSKALREAE